MGALDKEIPLELGPCCKKFLLVRDYVNRGEVILWAVRWYCRYGISYRELEEMLCEHGVDVDHSTIYRWVQQYAPEMERRFR